MYYLSFTDTSQKLRPLTWEVIDSHNHISQQSTLALESGGRSQESDDREPSVHGYGLVQTVLRAIYTLSRWRYCASLLRRSAVTTKRQADS